MLVGHDRGAAVVYAASVLHPSRVAGVVGVSVQPRYLRQLKGKVPYVDLLRKAFGEGGYYILKMQKEGVAEAELEADVPRSLRMILSSLAGEFQQAVKEYRKNAPKPSTTSILQDYPDL